MGRITIFTEPDCPDSAQVRTALQRRDIPYEEIDLAKHPERRADMISLTHSLKIPQVFFNSEHVGSSEEARSLLVAWDTEAMFSGYNTSLERYQVEIANEEDPVDDRLRLPLPDRDNRSKDAENDSVHLEPNQNTSEAELSSVSGVSVHDFEDADDQEAGGDINNDDIFLPGKSTLSALTVTRELVAHLPRSSRMIFRPRKDQGPSSSSTAKPGRIPSLPLPHFHKSCFHGNDAVFTLMLLYDISSREEAIEVCNNLQTKRVIHSVAHKRNTKTGEGEGGPDTLSQFKDDGDNLYRLQPFQESDVLNSFRAYKVTKSKKNNLAMQDPIHFVNGLRRLLAAMIDSATDDDGKIEFDAIRRSAPFSAFEGGACKLRSVDMSVMAEKTRKAFLINVFNIMALHAIIRWDMGKIRRAFFDQVKYRVGDVVISCADIYGMLKGANMSTRRRSKIIPKKKKSIQSLALSTAFDPRIHFALSFGARSSPSVESTYTPEALNEELQVAAETVCSAEIEIDEERCELVLPAIMGRYRKDFAPNVSELPGLVLKYMNSKEQQLQLERMLSSKKAVRIKFHDFDWRTNAAHVVSPVKLGSAASTRRSSLRRPSNVVTYAPPRALEVESWPLTSKSTSADAPWDLSSLHEHEEKKETPSASGNLHLPSPMPISTPECRRNVWLPFRRQPDINPNRSADNTEPTQRIHTHSSGMSSSLDSGDHREVLPSPKPFDAKSSMQTFVASFSRPADFAFVPEDEESGSDVEGDVDGISYAFSNDVYAMESQESSSVEHWDNITQIPAAASVHLLESNHDDEDEDEDEDLFSHSLSETDGGTFDLAVKAEEGEDVLACKQLWVGDFGEKGNSIQW